MMNDNVRTSRHPRTRDLAPFALAGILACLCASPPARAATITVTHFGDDIYCDAIGCSLRGALLAARSGDTVVWAAGLSYPAVTTLTDTILGRPLLILSGVNVQGPGADKLAIDAQHLSRVFSIETRSPDPPVTLSGLSLINGRAEGVNYPHTNCAGITDSGEPGAAGGPAEGGCSWGAAATTLNLERVALDRCAAIGGRGQDGRGDVFGLFGTDGGAGGMARGGAIFSLGNLGLREVSLNHSTLTGGDGGWGQLAFMSGTHGNGGDGGDASGGVVWVAGSMDWRNVSIADTTVKAGDRGNVCNSGDASAGSGGNVFGGAVATSAPATISFSSLEINGIQAGVNPRNGATGTINGNVLNSSGPVILNHSVLNAAVGNGDVDPSCMGASIVASGSQSRGPCADASVNPLGMFTPIIASNGIMTLMPEATSPIIDAASNCMDANANTVLFDARGMPRPFNGACDLGAHEYEGILFKNGFE